jgi:hypothetical protein
MRWGGVGMRSKAAIRRTYFALKRMGPQEAQRRGYRLEDVVFDLLAHEALEPVRHVSPPGEELDFYFTDGVRHFLMEARWRKKVTAADVFAFRGKLEGKLLGTLGIFLSVDAPFSTGAVQAVTWGKQVNTLLFDGVDLEYALSPAHSFRSVLDVKIRRAVQYGDISYEYEAFLDEQAKQDSTGRPLPPRRADARIHR